MRTLFKLITRAHAWFYRRRNGRIPGGESLLLLTTIGRKSGKSRTSPLMRLNDHGNYLVAASAGGSPSHPDWYRNLEADPLVRVQVGEVVEPRHARIAAGKERDELFQRFVDRDRRFGKYQDNTDRQIPVIVLEPVGK